MKVIGTAGHIDHGKSALVRRLTGIDPDRLSEEKLRGMTIDLGFAWLSLPSGRDVSVIDVPGHERFVKNMLAGAGGVDVALLVIAADEGVMPQTREHLDILDLLNIRHGVVALTKVDLVDEDWQELVMGDVREALEGTTLEASPIVPVSAVSGQGIQDLLGALDEAVVASPEPIDVHLPYLPVDRVFTVAGFGTVVTGTLHNGSLKVGDEVELQPGGVRGRIRSLQTHRRQVDEARPASRVAANLVGLHKEKIVRGSVIALPGTVHAPRRADGWLRVLADAPFPLGHAMKVSAHIGAAEREATVTLLDRNEIPPGDAGWVQLRFSSPVPAVRGQRFILRLPAPARTVAGGEILDVSPRHRRSDPAALGRLARLQSPSLHEAVRAALPRDRPQTAAQLASALGVGVAEVLPTLERMAENGTVAKLGNAFLSTTGWEILVARATALVGEFHEANPLRKGMPKEELRSRLRRTRAHWASELRTLAESGLLREDGPVVSLPSHRGGTVDRREDVNRVLMVLRQEPFSPPGEAELLATSRTDASLLAAMVEEGAIVRVTEGVYFARDVYDRMVASALYLIQKDGQVTVATLRDALGTSRKYTLAFLEHLDAQRVTRRQGDVRVLGSQAS